MLVKRPIYLTKTLIVATTKIIVDKIFNSLRNLFVL